MINSCFVRLISINAYDHYIGLCSQTESVGVGSRVDFRDPFYVWLAWNRSESLVLYMPHDGRNVFRITLQE